MEVSLRSFSLPFFSLSSSSSSLFFALLASRFFSSLIFYLSRQVLDNQLLIFTTLIEKKVPKMLRPVLCEQPRGLRFDLVKSVTLVL